MSILLSDLLLYGAATIPDDDTLTNIGGAALKSAKYDFTDIGAAMMGLSDNGGDTSQTLQIYYRDAAGNYLSETKTLTGQTGVNFTAVPERLEKGIKSGTTAGNIALVTQTPFYDSGSAKIAAAAAQTVTLDAAASAVDQAYRGMILLIKGGTGQYQLRQIVDYIGATKVATLNAVWAVNPSATDSTYAIYQGFFFNKVPNEILQVRRPFIGVIANAAGGADKDYFEKFFYWNNHASLDLTTAQVLLASNPSGLITIGVEGALDGTTGNGPGNNRQVAPAGISFSAGPCNVPNSGSLTHGTACPGWMKLHLPAGTAAQKTTFSLQCQGASV